MNNKALVYITSVAMICVSGCANVPANPNVIQVSGGLMIDGYGKDHARIWQDASECKTIADASDPAGKAVAGAIAGALVGALLGAAIYRGSGLSGNSGASYGAAVGGVSGVAGGAGAGAQDYRTIMRNCMAGRGWSTLN